MYFPSIESDLRLWTENFHTLITATPTLYGLVAGDATIIAAACTDWETNYDALVTARASHTETPAMVLDKDVAKAEMQVVCRSYSQSVRNNPNVSDANKLALGLTLVDTTRTPIPPPTTYPVLQLSAPGPLTQTLKYADNETPTRRARPAGASAMEVFITVGTAPAVDPSASQYRRLITRQPFVFDFASDQAGKIATYFGRWINSKGDAGPFSAATSLAIP